MVANRFFYDTDKTGETVQTEADAVTNYFDGFVGK